VLRTPLRTALVSVAAALTVVTTAAAITGSTPDGQAHPYVGALVVDGSVACSGVLIAPNVFATAGHCGANGARVQVSLDTKLDDSWTLLGGTLAVDASKQSDLAVVVLDAAAPVAPATLAKAGSVASLNRTSVVTSVGYGYSGQAADGSWIYDGLRRVADSPVLDVAKSTLKFSTKQAGPCMGDSGGPQLAGNTVLSLTSSGPKDCTGRSEGYRVDTVSARSFLGQYVTLP
jgi:hypothetical protein